MTDLPLSNIFDLSGKTAVVTGGCGIIGNKVCRGLAAHGASVIIADIDNDRMHLLADEIGHTYGTLARGILCDVADPASVAAMVGETIATFGNIDILHNNAATKSRNMEKFFAPVEEYELETWREIMAVNLDGMFLVAQAVGRRMVEQGTGGSIIQTASLYGITAPDQRIYEGSEYMGIAINTPPVYAAAKAGVVGLSKYLASYWAPHNIRVNTLVPGGVESGQNDVFQTNYASKTPLGRMARDDEMVGAVIYLAADASSYMTGQMLTVDGGWTA